MEGYRPTPALFAYFKIKNYDVNTILQKFHKLIFTANFHTKRLTILNVPWEDKLYMTKSIRFWNITFLTHGNFELSLIAKRYNNIYISAGVGLEFNQQHNYL